MADFLRKVKSFFVVMTIFTLVILIIPIAYLNQQEGYNEGEFIAVTSSAGVRSYRLFNSVTIKKENIGCVRYAYAGGFPIGISIKTDGVLVEGVGEINTVAGKASLKNEILSGDVILSIDDRPTNFTEDISKILGSLKKDIKSVKIKILRGKNYIEQDVSPLIEEYTGNFKLGLRVKDAVAGVGTMTFIKEDGDFAALGHPICNFATNECLSCSSGSIYDCKVIGVNKGSRGRAGELKATLRNIQTPLGNIIENNKFGIYGKMRELYTGSKLYEVGDRAAVMPGKAQMLTTVGDKTEFYDIEIIKASHQNIRNDKSMVIRVTDKRLLEQTGGVVQGMSGSPIIQNDKLIGAVTHVFVNDPTKGYGIYMDWMY